MQTLKSFFTEMGLSQNDQQVYVTVHRYSRSPASAISLRSGIGRTTVYACLARLMRQGLIEKTDNAAVARYFTVAPDAFLCRLDSHMEELKAKRQRAEEGVAALYALAGKNAQAPKFQIFEGASGVRQLYERTLTEGSQQKAFLTIARIPSELKEFMTHTFIALKKKRRVTSKVLLADGRYARRYQALDAKANRTTVLVKAFPFKLSTEIILCSDFRVAMVDFQADNYGVLLHSEPVHTTLMALFDYIWANETKNNTQHL